MASTDKLMRARTKFKVINSKGSHFKMSMSSTVTGRKYHMPGQFTTYYGSAFLSLDIKTYGNWKGELWAATYSNGESGRDYGEHTTYFLTPWTGYDTSRLSSIDLIVQSCKLTYNADYMVDETQEVVNISEQEILNSIDDLDGLLKRIGSVVRPTFPAFIYSSGSSFLTRLSRTNPYLAFPSGLPDQWQYFDPIDMIDGVRKDTWSGGTYTVTSSVNIELVE